MRGSLAFSGRRRLDEAREDAARRRQGGAAGERLVQAREAPPVGRDRKLIQKLRAALGHEGLDQDGDATHHLGHHIEHRAHARLIGLAQRPGGLLVDIAIGGAHHLPDGFQRVVERLTVDLRARPAIEGLGRIQQRLIGRGEGARHRQSPATVLGDHREHPLGEIAQVIGEVAVHAVDHGAMGEIAVIAEGHLAHQEIAHGIQTVALDERPRLDDVAQGFRDLLALIGPPAMGEDPARHRQVGRHQEGRPIDRVEAQDVLAHHMQIGRPEALVAGTLHIGETGGGDVVGERVEPDIHDMGGIARHRHAPCETGARDREIPQAAAHEAGHLVAPALRGDEIRMRGVEFQQALLPGAEPEEVTRLLHPFDLGAGRGDLLAVGAGGELVLGVIGLVADGIPAGVFVEIDLAALDQPLPDRLAGADMARLGGADEIVIAEVHRLGEIAEVLRDLVGEGLGRHAGGDGGLLHLLPMLVGAGQEHHVIAVQALEARQHVAGERRIGMPDMRRVIDVVDRRGDVVAALGHGSLQWAALFP